MASNQPEDLARSIEGENDPGFENPMEYLILGATIGLHEMFLEQVREGYPEGAIAFLERSISNDSPC